VFCGGAELFLPAAEFSGWVSITLSRVTTRFKKHDAKMENMVALENAQPKEIYQDDEELIT
jgi:hypothetical protein